MTNLNIASEGGAKITALELMAANDICEGGLYVKKSVEDYEADFEANVDLALQCIRNKTADGKTVRVSNGCVFVKFGIGEKNSQFNHGLHRKDRFIVFGDNWDLAEQVVQSVKSGIQAGEYRTALIAFAKEQKRLSDLRQAGLHKTAA